MNLHTFGYKRMAVFADHGVSLSVYKIVCVCVGLGLSCRAWTTSVSLRKWLVKQLVLAKLSIMIPELVSCQYLVVVSQLCLKFHCVLLFGHLASKNHLPGFEKPHTGLLPIFRCSKASNLIALMWHVPLVDATSEQFKQKILQQHQNRSVDRRCAPTEQTNMNSEFSEGPQSTQDWLGDFRNPLCSWNLVFLEPCVPGTLSSWNPRFRNLGATHSVYWNPGFPEPRGADLLSRCPPPVSDCPLTGPLLVLEPWFSLQIGFLGPCP